MSLEPKLREAAEVAIDALTQLAKRGTPNERTAAAIELMNAITILHHLEGPAF